MNKYDIIYIYIYAIWVMIVLHGHYLWGLFLIFGVRTFHREPTLAHSLSLILILSFPYWAFFLCGTRRVPFWFLVFAFLLSYKEYILCFTVFQMWVRFFFFERRCQSSSPASDHQTQIPIWFKVLSFSFSFSLSLSQNFWSLRRKQSILILFVFFYSFLSNLVLFKS